MRRLVLVLAAGMLLPACGVNRDNYVEKFVKVRCELYECYEDFEEYWNDVDECVDEALGYLEDYLDEYYADCEFSRRNATKCINSYKKISCEDFESGDYEYDGEACEDIWEC
jgi:hypothetical protein